MKYMTTIRHIIATVLRYCSLLLFISSSASAGDAALKRPIVVELFTSQGCSSCPPADELMGELVKEKGLLPLSFHVDYWNRLGWVDPFSHAHFSGRQYLYNRTLRSPGNYTPQMIVDGKLETIGSYRRAVRELIDAVKTNAETIPVTLTQEKGDILVVSVDGHEALPSPANLWIIGYDNQHTSYINAGENRGRQLTTYNVVRYIKPLSTYDGKPLRLKLQLHWPEPVDNVAVILQENPVGKVLGSASQPTSQTSPK